jgi:EmrB/QacA subfamily drug resistance transporter
MFISTMDMTIVNVALPDMSNDLDAGIGELQRVLDAFLVSLAGLLLVGNGLADRFGRRRVFLLGLLGFAVTSVLASAAATVGNLIAARVLMGVAASCVMPPALSLLAVIFPPEMRSRAAGVWSAVAGLGLALGPVLGGVLVDAAGWRWVFLVNVPFVLLAAPFGLRWLPESRRAGVPPLDIPSVALSTLALGGIVFTLIEGVDAGWTSPAVIIAAITGVAAGVAFVATELRRRHPLFDVRVLARQRVAAGALVILAAYIATLGMLFVLLQYVQYVQDGSAFASGLEVAPFGLGLGLLASVSGRLVARFGSAGVLLAGLLTAAAGFVPLLFLTADSSAALVLLGTALVGCGIGAMAPPGDGGDHERRGDREGRRRGRREPGRAAGRRRARCGDRGERVRRGLRRRDQRRQPRARGRDGVDRGRNGRGEPPARRRTCRPSERRRRELRRGGPGGPCRLHGGPPPRGGERGRRAVTGIPGRVTTRLNRESVPSLGRRRGWRVDIRVRRASTDARAASRSAIPRHAAHADAFRAKRKRGIPAPGAERRAARGALRSYSGSLKPLAEVGANDHCCDE